MSWCPKCKSEYVIGNTKCKDCGTDLVDFLMEETKENSETSRQQSKQDELKQKPTMKKNKIAFIIKISAVLLLIIGFLYAIYITNYTRDYGLKVLSSTYHYDWNDAIQQFISYFKEFAFMSLIILALGEAVQILHDMRTKIYDK